MIIKHTVLKIWISENKQYSNLPNNHVRPVTRVGGRFSHELINVKLIKVKMVYSCLLNHPLVSKLAQYLNL